MFCKCPILQGFFNEFPLNIDLFGWLISDSGGVKLVKKATIWIVNLYSLEKLNQMFTLKVLAQGNTALCVSICRKGLTWKYYAKKILYFLRQQNILKNLKEYLQRPTDRQSFLEGKSLAEVPCKTLNESFIWKEPSLPVFQLVLGQRRIKFGFLMCLKSFKSCRNCTVLHRNLRIPLDSVSAVCLNNCTRTGELKSNREMSSVMVGRHQIWRKKRLFCNLCPQSGGLFSSSSFQWRRRSYEWIESWRYI